MRVAVITGGMGGLGESISTKMHAAGYRVVVTHSPGNTRVKDWLGEHNAAGRQFSAYGVDVADFDSCKDCVACVTKDVGPIDILVNNAGITKDTTFKKMTKADWDAVIRTNLDCVFNMTKHSSTAWSIAAGGASSTSRRSTVRRARSGRPTIRQRRPACTVSPRRWRSKSRGRA